MTTAVDSSVLLDVFQGHPEFGELSRLALKRAFDAGALVACEIVWAETRAHFPDDRSFLASLAALGIRFDPLGAPAAATAGDLWRTSRQGVRGKKPPRDRVVADFLIGAHAQHQAEALLTRDDGFYRRHFRALRVISPAEP